MPRRAGCLRKKAVVSSPPVGIRSPPHHTAGCINVHSGARHWHCVHLYGRDSDLAGPKAVGRDTGGIKRKSTMTSAPEA